MADSVRRIRFTSALGFYAGFCRKYAAEIFWSTFFCILKTVPFFLTPLFLKVIVDTFIPASDIRSICWMFALVLGICVINVFFHTLYRASFIWILRSVSRDLRNVIVGRLQMLSLSYHNRHETGRYYSKIMIDVERTEGFADHACQNIFMSLLMMAFFLVILAMVSLKMLGLFLLLLPGFQLLIWLFNRVMRRSRHMQRMAQENLSASVNAFLQTSLLARLHGDEAFEREKIDVSNRALIRETANAEAVAALFGSMNSVLVLFFNFLVIAVGGIQVIEKEITLGEMLLFTSYVSMLMGYVSTIIGSFPVITQFSESIQSIQEILTAPDLEQNHGRRPIERLKGAIEFERVTFRYEGTEMSALSDLSVRIPSGATVGLAGRSGSGKTTFVNLVLGLYRTREGRVLLDGISVNELDMRTARRNVGVVNQEPILFTGTIYDNITHAYKNLPMERIVEAARRANAHDFITALPQGYESPVGERGVLLSGGQKQRLALARAILRDPAILVLDEATSALDSESERLVQEAIDRLAGTRTTLIIAHRLSTIRNADVILFFDAGRIIEQGTHAELIALDGEYARMVRLQSFEETGHEIDGGR